tara:strand:+ start:43 stop:420 length:378 start_codon:yes stop_codon:yes gene_type:complete
MPTKKGRVGFIPRSDVLDIIKKLSYESNLSYSKIINILVEEALYKRGMLNSSGKVIEEKNYDITNNYQGKIGNSKNEFSKHFKNNLLKNKNGIINGVEDDALDNEIYTKFLMFLRFQERMKNKGI